MGRGNSVKVTWEPFTKNQTGGLRLYSLIHQLHRVNILAHRAEEQFALGVCRIFCELKFPVAQLFPEAFALRHTGHLRVVHIGLISRFGHVAEGVSIDIEGSCVLRAGHGQGARQRIQAFRRCRYPQRWT